MRSAMFTGLIEEIGTIQEIIPSELGMKITISCQRVLEGINPGDSIAVNGVCLTAVATTDTSFTADVMHETVHKTTLASYEKGTYVNLERALAVGQRMGGHFVQGHVDGTGCMAERKEIGNAVLFRFSVKSELTHWMVQKGSIAINGISLTLVDVGEDFFTVSIIPHTLCQTNLGHLNVGDTVNIECDIVGKYIAKWAGIKEDTHVLSPY